MADLVLNNIRKAFGQTVAVDDLSLVVDQGEYVALLGPSGCGKTTTLRIVAGFEEPDQGEVQIKGEDVTKRPAHRRDVGFVFQSYALFPHMTVSENVAYGLRMRKLPNKEIKERVGEALDLVRLGNLGKRFPRQLSGGQQQRVALARVIVLRPSILLFDEPLSNLDARLRQDMQVELRQLQRALGVATVHVTHDQEEALTVADRIIVMNAGKVMQEGRPDIVYQKPENPFVANFIGHCNFIEGEIIAQEEVGVSFKSNYGFSFCISESYKTLPGSVGMVAIRPESFLILKADEEIPHRANISNATVQIEVFLGAVRHVHVKLETGEELLIYQQMDIASNNRPKRYSVGEPIRVSWLPEACIFHPIN